MSIITVETTVDYRYLMNKSKHNLAYMYLNLLRDYEKERLRNTPRPAYGIKIVIDETLPPYKCEVVDLKGNLIGKVSYE